MQKKCWKVEGHWKGITEWQRSKYEHVCELHSSIVRSVFGSHSNVVIGRSVLSLGVQEMHLLYQLSKFRGGLFFFYFIIE